MLTKHKERNYAYYLQYTGVMFVLSTLKEKYVKRTQHNFKELNKQPLPFSTNIKKAPAQNLEKFNDHLTPPTLSFILVQTKHF